MLNELKYDLSGIKKFPYPTHQYEQKMSGTKFQKCLSIESRLILEIAFFSKSKQKNHNITYFIEE